jgi:hypothetical protein
VQSLQASLRDIEGIRSRVEGELADWDQDLPSMNERMQEFHRERAALRRSIIRGGVSNIAAVLNAVFLQTGVHNVGIPLENIEGICSSDKSKQLYCHLICPI